MEPTFSTLMTGCLNITDPKQPTEFIARMEFYLSSPLEFRFWFLDHQGIGQTWTIGRQLVIDGLEAPLLTGLGDFKARSTSKRFIAQLFGGESYATVSLPREQVQFVVEEAERECPLRNVSMEPSDDEIAAWLA